MSTITRTATSTASYVTRRLSVIGSFDAPYDRDEKTERNCQDNDAGAIQRSEHGKDLTPAPLVYQAPSKAMQWVGSQLGLKEPSDVWTISVVLLCLAVNVYIWTHASAMSPLQLLGTWLLLVQLTASVSTIVHNTIHYNIFYNPMHNRIFHLLLTICFGHPVCTFVSAHNLSHHRYTQMAEDHMRTTQMRYKYHLWNYMCFFGRVGNVIAASDMRYMRLMKRQGKRIWTEFALQMSTVVVMHVFCALANPLYWIMFWNGPRMAASIFITNMNMLQHDGCAKPINASAKDPLHKSPGAGQLAPIHIVNVNTSRNFTGFMTNALFFNNGYHGIHHIKPTLHWSKLPQAHAYYVKPHIHPNLDQVNMLTYFVRTFVFNQRTLYTGEAYHPDQMDGPVEPENENWIQYPAEFEFIAKEAPQLVMLDILDDIRVLLLGK